jgi:hypothetical protein
MNLKLVFTVRADDEATGRDQATEAAHRWAAAEPKVRKIRVLSVRRPFPDRLHWWEVEATLSMGRPTEAEQPTLWGTP